LTDSNPALDQEAADLIGHTGALAYQARAHAMEGKQVHLLRRLDAHEPHLGFRISMITSPLSGT
jgi:hypothetical protein